MTKIGQFLFRYRNVLGPVLFLVALALSFSRLFSACTRKAPIRTAALLAALAVLAPSFFLRLGFDYGRFDSVNLTLAIAALSLIHRGRLIGAGCLGAASVLIHEGFIVLQFPLLLAFALAQNPARDRARSIAWRLAILPLAATALVFACGSYRPGLASLAEYFAHNRAYLALDGQVNLDAIAIPTRHFFENFGYNAAMFAQKRAWLHVPVTAVWFGFFYACYAGFHRRNGLAIDWLFLSALSPLLMSLIAWDYYRWFALASVNMIVVMLLRTRAMTDAGKAPVLDFDGSLKVILASFLLGPISNSTSFPLAFTMLGKVFPGLKW